ncbi:hypothetical protein B0H13DRAFT_916661 [Mycena leptocephala]|nr:hypothetical protein B0H13DRAFT_916661 [Mycena leptocephala]
MPCYHPFCISFSFRLDAFEIYLRVGYRIRRRLRSLSRLASLPKHCHNSPSFSLLPITRPLLLPHLRTHRTQYRLTQSISSMLARDFGRGVGWKRGMANGQLHGQGTFLSRRTLGACAPSSLSLRRGGHEDERRLSARRIRPFLGSRMYRPTWAAADEGCGQRVHIGMGVLPRMSCVRCSRYSVGATRMRDGVHAHGGVGVLMHWRELLRRC